MAAAAERCEDRDGRRCNRAAAAAAAGWEAEAAEEGFAALVTPEAGWAEAEAEGLALELRASLAPGH